MRFDIRNYFKTGKTPYTAQFLKISPQKILMEV